MTSENQTEQSSEITEETTSGPSSQEELNETPENTPASEHTQDDPQNNMVEDVSSDNDDKGSTRWTEGDDIELVRVRFPGNSRSFAFLVGKRSFRYGQKVVAMSDRGMDVGYINSFPYSVKFKKSMLPIRTISKVAEEADIQAMQGDFRKQKEAEKEANKLIDELKLDMQITHVEIIQFGKKMVFYFTAPARVDFRELVKRLVGELKMRIELRQISVRDRAAALGSIGACGLATCCSTFLKNYGNVSIKMAKNQNLALIPSKINGVCGQIKCCIKYEDDVYSDKRKLLPKEGNFVEAANGDKGKVTKLHILVEQFDMITEKGQIRRYSKTQYHEGKKLDRSYKFPDSFSHVVNETSNVIGLNDVQSSMANSFNKGLSEEEVALKNLESIQGAGEGESENLFSNLKDNIRMDKSSQEHQEKQETQVAPDNSSAENETTDSQTKQSTQASDSEEGQQEGQEDKPKPKRNNRNRRNRNRKKGPNKKDDNNNKS